MDNIQHHTLRCKRCGFIWRQLAPEGTPKTKACPKCDSPEWNKSKSRPDGN